jgi:hypothetical protein
MKKQIIILLLFSIQLSAQNKDPNPHFPKLKIPVPCTQDFINSYKGKWLIPPNTLFNSANNNYSQGAMTRIKNIHELVRQVYPQPMGSDGYWVGSYRKTYFGDKVKYVTENNRTTRESVTLNQVEGWAYGMKLFAWGCTENANEIWNGYPDAGLGGAITVYANDLLVLIDELDDAAWTIDGRPIKKKMPVVGRWKGYDILARNGGEYAQQNSDFYILISRNEMLPYIPVTRKQYLDRAIQFITTFYDGTNKKIEETNQSMPAQYRAPQEEINNQKALNTKARNDALKKLEGELEKTTKNGLLEATAVVRIDPLFTVEGPIFLPEKDGGTTLVIENPNYFRKDLPKYVPQVLVMEFIWSKEKWATDFRTIIEENFPIEKLQAMIDK